MKSERELLRENLERFRTKNPHKTADPAKRSPKFQKLNESAEDSLIQKAIDLYTNGDFQDAKDTFESILGRRVSDGEFREALYKFFSEDLTSEELQAAIRTWENGPEDDNDYQWEELDMHDIVDNWKYHHNLQESRNLQSRRRKLNENNLGTERFNAQEILQLINQIPFEIWECWGIRDEWDPRDISKRTVQQELQSEDWESVLPKLAHIAADLDSHGPNILHDVVESGELSPEYEEIGNEIGDALYDALNLSSEEWGDYLYEGKHPIKDPAKRQPKFRKLNELRRRRLNESAEDSCQQARDYCIEKGLHIKPVSWLEKYMDFPESYEEQYPDESESDLRDRMWTDATENGAAIALQEIEAILRAGKEDEYNLYDMIDTDYSFSIVDDPNLSPEDFNY